MNHLDNPKAKANDRLNPFLIRESFERSSKILAFKINGLEPLILSSKLGQKVDEILIKLSNNFLANSSLATDHFTKFFNKIQPKIQTFQ